MHRFQEIEAEARSFQNLVDDHWSKAEALLRQFLAAIHTRIGIPKVNTRLVVCSEHFADPESANEEPVNGDVASVMEAIGQGWILAGLRIRVLNDSLHFPVHIGMKPDGSWVLKLHEKDQGIELPNAYTEEDVHAVSDRFSDQLHLHYHGRFRRILEGEPPNKPIGFNP